LTRNRVLVWDGCVNVRDLGGLPLAGSGETKFRVVVRADSIGGLTEEGWRALRNYGVQSAVDLRADEEVAQDARRAAPIPVVRAPIVPWEIAPLADNWPSMRVGYLALLERFRPQFVRAVAAIATAEEPIVIHCQGGRDRTGLVVALVLALAGVDAETIAADHALSDANWAPFLDAWYAEAETEEERERRRHITRPAGRTMVEILGEVDSRHGGPDAYLREGGVTGEQLDRLVLRLRP
jgi:protein-tyrosine phosphatase